MKDVRRVCSNAQEKEGGEEDLIFIIIICSGLLHHLFHLFFPEFFQLIPLIGFVGCAALGAATASIYFLLTKPDVM